MRIRATGAILADVSGSDGAPRDRQVDVVIPTFNNPQLVIQCIAALADPLIARVIVVDDASTDSTSATVLRVAPHVTLVVLPEHRGLSHALNQGLARGDAPYVLFLNDDVVACESAVDRLVGHLQCRPDLVFAAGRLVDPGTHKTQERYKPRLLPSSGTLIARLVGIERYWPANPWSGRHVRDPLPETGPSTIRQQPAGACLLVRRSALENIGGWDERFWFWYEDVDLAARLLELGQGIWDPLATFGHIGRHSTRTWDKPTQHVRLYHSTLHYTRKHLAPPGRWLVSVVALTVFAVRVPAYALAGRREAAQIYLSLMRQAAAVAVGRDPGPPFESATHRGP